MSTAPPAPIVPRPLFGGAIVMPLPADFIDASDLRQVPDTQEVFLEPQGEISAIVEILQPVEPEDPAQAAQFHFDSLAHDNSALSSSLLSPPSQPYPTQNPPPTTLAGTQKVTKFNAAEPDDVRIYLSLWRVPRKADVVLSVNVPVRRGERGEAEVRRAEEVWRTATEGFKILDFGLFA